MRLFLPVALVAIASVARAQDCDVRVLDMAGAVRDVPRVEAALASLRSHGIDAHVVTLADLGAASNLDDAIRRIGESCPSWQSGGQRRPDILVVAVSFGERQSGIYYGTSLDSRLASQAERIRSDVMGPLLQAGRNDDAFVAVAEETARVMARAGQAQPGRAPASRASGLGPLAVGVALVAAGLGGVVLFRRMRRRRTASHALGEARAAADAAGRRSTNEIASLIQECAALTERVNILKGDVEDAEVEPLLASLAEAQGLLDAATLAQSTLVEEATSKPPLTLEACKVQEAAFEKLLRDAAPARSVVTSARARLEELVQALASVDEALAQAQGAVDAAPASLAASVPAGFRVDSLQRAIDEARGRLDEARALVEKRRPVAAVEAARSASALCARALELAARLPAVRAETEAAMPGLRARLARVAREIDAAHEVFDAMKAAFPESCWANVRGNGTEATNRLEAARVEADEAEALAKEGDWAGSADDVEDAAGHLDDAESLLRSILARRDHLERARRDAPAEIEAASADVAKASAFVREHPGDYSPQVADGLARAERRLAEARAELGAALPDVVAVVGAALEANAAADEVLARALAEHEERERRRREADSTLRDAERKVSKAAEYAEDHRREILADTMIGARIREAADLLAEARASDDPARRVELARRAHDAATSAYDRAAQLVDRAEDERRRQRSGAAWGAPWVIPIPGSSPRSGRGWSGAGGGGRGRLPGGWGGGGGSSGGWGGGGGGGRSSGGW